MSTVPALMTVEEFQALPPDKGELVHELHHGEIVTMTSPKSKHFKLQMRLASLLRPKAEHLGIVEIEVPFRAVPQFDLRAADVAFVSRARWESIDPEDNLRGAPELVIEVKSPSNTWRELRERASLCLANGCLDFGSSMTRPELSRASRRMGKRQGMRRPIAFPYACSAQTACPFPRSY